MFWGTGQNNNNYYFDIYSFINKNEKVERNKQINK
jgi:hypothetical protein